MSYEEQTMSQDKYPNMFSPQMEAIAFIIFQIFFAKRSFENWGILSDISLRPRALLLVFEKFNPAYLFQIALEIM